MEESRVHADDSMSIDWTLNMRRKCNKFFESTTKQAISNNERYYNYYQLQQQHQQQRRREHNKLNKSAHYSHVKQSNNSSYSKSRKIRQVIDIDLEAKNFNNQNGELFSDKIRTRRRRWRRTRGEDFVNELKSNSSSISSNSISPSTNSTESEENRLFCSEQNQEHQDYQNYKKQRQLTSNNYIENMGKFYEELFTIKSKNIVQEGEEEGGRNDMINNVDNLSALSASSSLLSQLLNSSLNQLIEIDNGSSEAGSEKSKQNDNRNEKHKPNELVSLQGKVMNCNELNSIKKSTSLSASLDKLTDFFIKSSLPSSSDKNLIETNNNNNLNEDLVGCNKMNELERSSQLGRGAASSCFDGREDLILVSSKSSFSAAAAAAAAAARRRRFRRSNLIVNSCSTSTSTSSSKSSSFASKQSSSSSFGKKKKKNDEEEERSFPLSRCDFSETPKKDDDDLNKIRFDFLSAGCRPIQYGTNLEHNVAASVTGGGLKPTNLSSLLLMEKKKKNLASFSSPCRKSNKPTHLGKQTTTKRENSNDNDDKESARNNNNSSTTTTLETQVASKTTSSYRNVIPNCELGNERRDIPKSSQAEGQREIGNGNECLMINKREFAAKSKNEQFGTFLFNSNQKMPPDLDLDLKRSSSESKFVASNCCYYSSSLSPLSTNLQEAKKRFTRGEFEEEQKFEYNCDRIEKNFREKDCSFEFESKIKSATPKDNIKQLQLNQMECCSFCCCSFLNNDNACANDNNNTTTTICKAPAGRQQQLVSSLINGQRELHRRRQRRQQEEEEESDSFFVRKSPLHKMPEELSHRLDKSVPESLQPPSNIQSSFKRCNSFSKKKPKDKVLESFERKEDEEEEDFQCCPFCLKLVEDETGEDLVELVTLRSNSALQVQERGPTLEQPAEHLSCSQNQNQNQSNNSTGDSVHSGSSETRTIRRSRSRRSCPDREKGLQRRQHLSLEKEDVLVDEASGERFFSASSSNSSSGGGGGRNTSSSSSSGKQQQQTSISSVSSVSSSSYSCGVRVTNTDCSSEDSSAANQKQAQLNNNNYDNNNQRIQFKNNKQPIQAVNKSISLSLDKFLKYRQSVSCLTDSDFNNTTTLSEDSEIVSANNSNNYCSRTTRNDYNYEISQEEELCTKFKGSLKISVENNDDDQHQLSSEEISHLTLKLNDTDEKTAVLTTRAASKSLQLLLNEKQHQLSLPVHLQEENKLNSNELGNNNTLVLPLTRITEQSSCSSSSPSLVLLQELPTKAEGQQSFGGNNLTDGQGHLLNSSTSNNVLDSNRIPSCSSIFNLDPRALNSSFNNNTSSFGVSGVRLRRARRNCSLNNNQLNATNNQLNANVVANNNNNNNNNVDEDFLDGSSMVEATAKLARVVSCESSSRASSLLSLNLNNKSSPLRERLLSSSLLLSTNSDNNNDKLVFGPQRQHWSSYQYQRAAREEPIYDIPSISLNNSPTINNFNSQSNNDAGAVERRCLSPDQKYPSQRVAARGEEGQLNESENNEGRRTNLVKKERVVFILDDYKGDYSENKNKNKNKNKIKTKTKGGYKLDNNNIIVESKSENGLLSDLSRALAFKQKHHQKSLRVECNCDQCNQLRAFKVVYSNGVSSGKNKYTKNNTTLATTKLEDRKLLVTRDGVIVSSSGEQGKSLRSGRRGRRNSRRFILKEDDDEIKNRTRMEGNHLQRFEQTLSRHHSEQSTAPVDLSLVAQDGSAELRVSSSMARQAKKEKRKGEKVENEEEDGERGRRRRRARLLLLEESVNGFGGRVRATPKQTDRKTRFEHNNQNNGKFNYPIDGRHKSKFAVKRRQNNNTNNARRWARRRRRRGGRRCSVCFDDDDDEGCSLFSLLTVSDDESLTTSTNSSFCSSCCPTSASCSCNNPQMSDSQNSSFVFSNDDDDDSEEGPSSITSTTTTTTTMTTNTRDNDNRRSIVYVSSHKPGDNKSPLAHTIVRRAVKETSWSSECYDSCSSGACSLCCATNPVQTLRDNLNFSSNRSADNNSPGSLTQEYLRRHRSGRSRSSRRRRRRKLPTREMALVHRSRRDGKSRVNKHHDGRMERGQMRASDKKRHRHRRGGRGGSRASGHSHGRHARQKARSYYKRACLARGKDPNGALRTLLNVQQEAVARARAQAREKEKGKVEKREKFLANVRGEFELINENEERNRLERERIDHENENENVVNFVDIIKESQVNNNNNNKERKFSEIMKTEITTARRQLQQSKTNFDVRENKNIGEFKQNDQHQREQQMVAQRTTDGDTAPATNNNNVNSPATSSTNGHDLLVSRLINGRHASLLKGKQQNKLEEDGVPPLLEAERKPDKDQISGKKILLNTLYDYDYDYDYDYANANDDVNLKQNSDKRDLSVSQTQAKEKNKKLALNEVDGEELVERLRRLLLFSSKSARHPSHDMKDISDINDLTTSEQQLLCNAHYDSATAAEVEAEERPTNSVDGHGDGVLEQHQLAGNYHHICRPQEGSRRRRSGRRQADVDEKQQVEVCCWRQCHDGDDKRHPRRPTAPTCCSAITTTTATSCTICDDYHTLTSARRRRRQRLRKSGRRRHDSRGSRRKSNGRRVRQSNSYGAQDYGFVLAEQQGDVCQSRHDDHHNRRHDGTRTSRTSRRWLQRHGRASNSASLIYNSSIVQQRLHHGRQKGSKSTRRQKKLIRLWRLKQQELERARFLEQLEQLLAKETSAAAAAAAGQASCTSPASLSFRNKRRHLSPVLEEHHQELYKNDEDHHLAGQLFSESAVVENSKRRLQLQLANRMLMFEKGASKKQASGSSNKDASRWRRRMEKNSPLLYFSPTKGVQNADELMSTTTSSTYKYNKAGYLKRVKPRNTYNNSNINNNNNGTQATMNELRAMQKALITSPKQKFRFNNNNNIKNNTNYDDDDNSLFMNRFLIKTSAKNKQLQLSLPNDGANLVCGSGNVFGLQLASRCQCSHCCLVEKLIQRDFELKRMKKLKNKINRLD